MPHAPDVERNLGLELSQRRFDVMADLDMYGALDLEILKAARAIRAREALLEPGPVFRHRAGDEAKRKPAVGNLGR